MSKKLLIKLLKYLIKVKKNLASVEMKVKKLNERDDTIRLNVMLSNGLYKKLSVLAKRLNYKTHSGLIRDMINAQYDLEITQNIKQN